ncbi:MAG: HAD-IA family hydrolase [Alphaproteobacteria bacterium]
MTAKPVRAVLWDFGGVVTESPFVAFARYERETGLPEGFIRGLNTRNPDSNAWARFERSEIDIDAFCPLFEAEAAEAGHRLDGRAVVALLAGPVRPEMVAALRSLRERYRIACLTNNVRAAPRPPDQARAVAEAMALFHAVIESSKVGHRKPEPRFYEIACEAVGVSPDEAVFLDDLGVNLKTARAMGMRTIKVESAAQALAELETVLGHAL